MQVYKTFSPHCVYLKGWKDTEKIQRNLHFEYGAAEAAPRIQLSAYSAVKADYPLGEGLEGGELSGKALTLFKHCSAISKALVFD